MTGRKSITEDDLGLSEFKPKVRDRSQAPIPAEAVKAVAEENGFPSRAANVVYVQYKTGRTELLGARISKQAHARFRAIVAEDQARFARGELDHKVTLGEIVEDALAALIEKRDGTN